MGWVNGNPGMWSMGCEKDGEKGKTKQMYFGNMRVRRLEMKYY